MRKVAGKEIPLLGAPEVGLDAAALGTRVVLGELFLPEQGEGAEILEGGDDEVAEALVQRLHERGGLPA